MSAPSPRPSKRCVACGRDFTWRRKWRDRWEEVRYCSQRCRRTRPSAVDREVESAIIALLTAREANRSMCPSEAARRVREEDWRSLLPAVRRAVERLRAGGVIRVTQSGRDVPGPRWRGPVRLRRGPAFEHGR